MEVGRESDQLEKALRHSVAAVVDGCCCERLFLPPGWKPVNRLYPLPKRAGFELIIAAWTSIFNMAHSVVARWVA